MRKRKFGAPRARRGETLAEVLVSLFIVVLAALLLAAMMTASAGINLTARQKDEKFYEAVSQVEAMSGTSVGGSVTITDNSSGSGSPTTVTVEVFTSENLAIYKKP